MTKVFFIVIILWVIYQINKFILGIQIGKSNNRTKDIKTRKSEMDILDAEYEEME